MFYDYRNFCLHVINSQFNSHTHSMTVLELFKILQELALAGHGDIEVKFYNFDHDDYDDVNVVEIHKETPKSVTLY